MITLLRCPEGWCCAVLLGLLVLAAPAGAAVDSNSLYASPSHFFDTVAQDYKDLYLAPTRWLQFGIAFGAGGLVANTSMDRKLDDWYQEHLRTEAGNRVSDVGKILGTPQYVVPLTVLAGVLGEKLLPDEAGSLVGTWGQRVTRAYLTGGPALLLAQYVTGSDRPIQGSSHWHAFRDGHGISGHSFIGAVPFLTAAQMFEDDPLPRYLLYAASVLPALSRINDSAHYPSQAFLGWFLAWEATSAIAQRERSNQQVVLTPAVIGDGYGVALCFRW